MVGRTQQLVRLSVQDVKIQYQAMLTSGRVVKQNKFILEIGINVSKYQKKWWREMLIAKMIIPNQNQMIL